MHLTHLACAREHDASAPQNVCTACGKPLYPQYDLAAAGHMLTKAAFATHVKPL